MIAFPKRGAIRQTREGHLVSNYTQLVTRFLLVELIATFGIALVARADIFQWEYIDPASPSQGKQQSATLTPDGAYLNALPGAYLWDRDLTMAYLSETDLTGAQVQRTNLSMAYLAGANLTGVYAQGAIFSNADLSHANLTSTHFSGALEYDEYLEYFYEGADLTDANLNHADLTNADFIYANLIGASLSNAEVRGANFYRDSHGGSGISLMQLYSTASYQAHNLTGTSFSGNDLSGANLASQNLTDASFSNPYGVGANLSGANLSQSNLTTANFQYARLTDADFTGADVRGANFGRSDYYNPGSGISLAQLYSTASYQTHELTGIQLKQNNLADANLVGQDLTNASFSDGTILTGADFTGATVRGADFIYSQLTPDQLFSTASFQSHDLSGIRVGYLDMSGANLVGQNLSNSWFGLATLTDADFTDAEIRGAAFRNLSVDQLYSTASYQAHDLTAINLGNTNLSGVNLAGQMLASADFSNSYGGADCNIYDNTSCIGANLTGANLSQANLTNADFSGTEVTGSEGQYYPFPGANLTGANLSGADARGANFFLATLDGANTSNLIQVNGHISGLELKSGASLLVRDYDGKATAYPPPGTLPVIVDQHLEMDASGTLRLEFDDDSWDSTISFAAGIPVARGGKLELTFAADVNLANQVGRTIDLFDWTGVTPTGAFTISSPYSWNLSKLYTTGEVTLAAIALLPGDYNGNGTVGPEDYNLWKANFGSTTMLAADGNGNHVVDAADFTIWRKHLGLTLGVGSGAALPSAEPLSAAVPEPASLLLVLMGIGFACLRGRNSYWVAELDSTCNTSAVDPLLGLRFGGVTFDDCDKMSCLWSRAKSTSVTSAARSFRSAELQLVGQYTATNGLA